MYYIYEEQMSGKFRFVNRTIKLWNQLPAEELATFRCRLHTSRKKIRKSIIGEVKRRDLKHSDETSESGGK
jgi:hypothetical protein